MDAERFLQAVDTVILEKRNRDGIGRLSEKVLHASIKLYLESDRTCHEVKVGSLVADVKNDEGIFEIQTGSFTPLRKKLDAFLPAYSVTVIYPMADRRRLIWIDENGVFSKPHTSPKKRQVLRVFSELIKIVSYLEHPNFHFRLLLFDLDEYRLKNGWGNGGKRGSTRYERIPTALKEEIVLESAADYAALLPASLPDTFDTRVFSQKTGLGGMALGAALKVLMAVGVLAREKQGRGYLYKKLL